MDVGRAGVCVCVYVCACMYMQNIRRHPRNKVDV